MHTSILMDAVAGKWNTKPETIQKLIKLGANVHARRADGLSVLMVATKNNSPWQLGILQILIDAEANISALDDKGRTFLMHFVSKLQTFGESEKLFLKQFLETEDWITDTCKNGHTAFMYAAKTANKEVMRFLLENGAAKNVPAAKEALKIFKANVEENYALEWMELNSFRTLEIDCESVFGPITEFDYIDELE